MRTPENAMLPLPKSFRYEIGDYAVQATCPCGKIPLPSLGPILGKVRGALVHRNEDRVMFTDLSVAFCRMEGIRQYQVIQEALEEFTVRVVSTRNLDGEIKSAFEAYFGYRPKLTICYETDIPREPNGKFHASICRI